MRRLVTASIVFLVLAVLYVMVRTDATGGISMLSEGTRDQVTVVAGIVFWLGAAWLANAVLAWAILHYARRRRSGTQLPKLMIDVGKLFVYFVAILIIISQVFERSLSGLLATSGFLAALIGLAVQKTIADAFAGIALNADNAIKLGDWIQTSTSVTGKVKEITWRATHLETIDGHQVVIPNSMLVANQFTNLNSPYRHFRLTKTLRMDYSVPAERVILILQSAMEATEGVLREPPPQVLIEDGLDGGVLYSMNYWALDYVESFRISRQVMINALKFVDRAGLAPSLPRQDVAVIEAAPRRIEAGIDVHTVLRRTPFFRAFEQPALEQIERNVHLRELPTGSVVVREGEAGSSLFIVVAGLLEASIQSPAAEMRVVGTLAPGDVFGEMSLLTGAARSATITARTHTTLLEIHKEQLGPILADRADLIAELSRLQAARLVNNEGVLSLSPEEQREVRAVGMAAFLGQRIKRFFNRVGS
jgi:small-conductance mechanosensitive channel/CRP-like cAMP-binding protein